jgi:hypothetical protein
MLSTLLPNNPCLTIDDLAIETIRECVQAEARLAAMIALEEGATVLVRRAEFVPLDNRVPMALWNVVIASGDFEGVVIDEGVGVEDAIILCDAVGFNYIVEM